MVASYRKVGKAGKPDKSRNETGQEIFAVKIDRQPVLIVFQDSFMLIMLRRITKLAILDLRWRIPDRCLPYLNMPDERWRDKAL